MSKISPANFVLQQVAKDAGLQKMSKRDIETGASLPLSIGKVHTVSEDAAVQVFLTRYGLDKDEIPAGLVRGVKFQSSPDPVSKIKTISFRDGAEAIVHIDAKILMQELNNIQSLNI